MKYQKYNIVPSKAKGGVSAVMENGLRFSFNDAQAQYISYCGTIGIDIVQGVEPNKIHIETAKFYYKMMKDLEKAKPKATVFTITEKVFE